MKSAIAATRINEVLSAPVMIDGRALVATVSIGVSMFPRDGATMGELLKHSDTAMYQAKDLGRNNFQVFCRRWIARSKSAWPSNRLCAPGLKLNQFDVHYQPIIDIHSRRVAGLEALLRWKHPTQGYVSPERFIEVAEETGLIIPIGQFVLDRIGRDISDVARAGRAPGAGEHERLRGAARAHQAARAHPAGDGEDTASGRS